MLSSPNILGQGTLHSCGSLALDSPKKQALVPVLGWAGQGKASMPGTGWLGRVLAVHSALLSMLQSHPPDWPFSLLTPALGQY